MIAFLGMYDLPELQQHNDTFWQTIRTKLGFGPAQLTRAEDPWPVWQSPGLLFAQTCGYPYRAKLHGLVNLVGTPDYGLPGCPPGYYRSVLVQRRAAHIDWRETREIPRFAYNEALSQSGWAAPVHWLLSQNIHINQTIPTGAHAASARAVADDRADLAGIDALTWVLLTEYDPELAAQLEVVAETEPTPGLPYITSSTQDPEHLFAAVRDAIKGLAPETRAALHLNGLVRIAAKDYLAVNTPPAPIQFDTSAGILG